MKSSKKNPKEFSKCLIELLIDESGVVRYGANRVISYLKSTKPSFKFSIDLNSYPEKEQWNLIASLLGLYTIQPKNLYLILPLRKSKYSFIRDTILIAKIKVLIESYGTTIINILDNNLDKSDPEDVQILHEMRSYDDSLKLAFQEKVKLKELNPRFTQSAILWKFRHKNDARIKESINKWRDEYDEQPFLNFATKVITARGKSWKIEASGSKEFLPMGQVSTTFDFPTEYFLNPNQYDRDAYLELQDKWS